MPTPIDRNILALRNDSRATVRRISRNTGEQARTARIMLSIDKALERKQGTAKVRDADVIFRQAENNKTIAIDPDKGEIASGPLKGTKVSKNPEKSSSSPPPKKEEPERKSSGSGQEYADQEITKYIDNPKSLGETTHSEKYDDFVQHGVNVKPLASGSQKGKPYKQGGGYKVGGSKDGKSLSYHPEAGSHHEGEYYKLASGKTGINSYNMDGTPKQGKK